jgi:hypothetical protein
MRVLRTVEDARRERAIMLFASGFLALVFAWMGLAWWLGRPGQPIDEALGVEVPPGSRQVYTEHVDSDPESPYEAVYVSATWTVNEAVTRFARSAAHRDLEARRFVMRDGTMIFVSPASDVPATHVTPIRPIREDVPLGTRSWIVIVRGTPPATTWTAAVPPNLES